MKTTKLRFAALAWIGFGMMSVSASADTLQMKDGRVIQGRFLGGTQASVQFEANGKIELYDVDQVISITFTGAPTPSSAMQTAPPAQVSDAPAANVPRWSRCNGSGGNEPLGPHD